MATFNWEWLYEYYDEQVPSFYLRVREVRMYALLSIRSALLVVNVSPIIISLDKAHNN